MPQQPNSKLAAEVTSNAALPEIIVKYGRWNLHWAATVPTATLVFTNTAAHLRGKTLARAPVTHLPAFRKIYSGHELTFVGKYHKVKFLSLYYIAVNSIFDSKQ